MAKSRNVPSVLTRKIFRFRQVNRIPVRASLYILPQHLWNDLFGFSSFIHFFFFYYKYNWTWIVRTVVPYEKKWDLKVLLTKKCRLCIIPNPIRSDLWFSCFDEKNRALFHFRLVNQLPAQPNCASKVQKCAHFTKNPLNDDFSILIYFFFQQIPRDSTFLLTKKWLCIIPKPTRSDLWSSWDLLASEDTNFDSDYWKTKIDLPLLCLVRYSYILLVWP